MSRTKSYVWRLWTDVVEVRPAALVANLVISAGSAFAGAFTAAKAGQRLRTRRLSLRDAIVLIVGASVIVAVWATAYRQEQRLMHRVPWAQPEPRAPYWLRSLVGDQRLEALRFNAPSQMRFDLPAHPELSNLESVIAEFPDRVLLSIEGRNSAEGVAQLRSLASVRAVQFHGVLDAELAVIDHLPDVRWLNVVSDDEMWMRPPTELTHALPAIEGLRNIECLFLNGWRLGDDVLHRLSVLGGLQVLHLEPSGVSDHGLRSLASLEELYVLELNKSSISDFGVSHLAQLSRLEILSLRESLLEGTTLNLLANCRRLSTLDLSGSPLDDRALVQLAALRSLKHLSLERTGIRGEYLAHLATMPRLECLLLGGNPVSAENLGKLATARRLRFLDLRNSPLDDGALPQLEQLQQLRRLDIGGTAISNDGAQALAAKLPTCEVVY